MDIVEKKKFVSIFEELAPWDRNEVLNQIIDTYFDFKTFLFDNGFSPFDFIDIKSLISHYGEEEILENISDYDLSDHLKDCPSSYDPDSIVSALCASYSYFEHKFTNADKDRIIALAEKIKEKKNKDK